MRSYGMDEREDPKDRGYGEPIPEERLLAGYLTKEQRGVRHRKLTPEYMADLLNHADAADLLLEQKDREIARLIALLKKACYSLTNYTTEPVAHFRETVAGVRSELERYVEGGPLLRKPNSPLPDGCYCKPGRCMAPKVMGMQQPCRDPQKAAMKLDNQE
jgi:hypothetical protein